MSVSGNLLSDAALLLGAGSWLGWSARPAVSLRAGSRVGPSLTRRIPGSVLRVVIALAGFGLAAQLWLMPS